MHSAKRHLQRINAGFAWLLNKAGIGLKRSDKTIWPELVITFTFKLLPNN
jgi:hypothetical protein